MGNFLKSNISIKPLFLLLLVIGIIVYMYSQNLITLPASEQPRVVAEKEVQIKVSFVEVPEKVLQGDKVIVSWKIDSNQQTKTFHTAIHYGKKSTFGLLGTGVKPDDLGYTDLTTEFVNRESTIPNTFDTVMSIGYQGTIYVRAHAIVDGKNYWSEERMLVAE